MLKRLRERIFKATKDKGYKGLRKLQKLLLNSISNN